jgi:hexokinase
MGKGFTIEGVEGYDLSTLFAEAFKRKVKPIFMHN